MSKSRSSRATPPKKRPPVLSTPCAKRKSSNSHPVSPAVRAETPRRTNTLLPPLGGDAEGRGGSAPSNKGHSIMASILVIGETDDSGLTAPTLELLGAASRLSGELGGGVALALIGSGLAAASAAAGPAGADSVYTADADSLAGYQTDSFLPVAQGIVELDSPSVILMSQSSIGRDLAPRLATRLGTAAIMDSLGLEVDGDRVKATRSCYGGNARQVVTVQTNPQVITVRPKSQDPIEADASRSAEVIDVNVAEPTLRARTTGKEQAESEGIRLEDAEIVVSGGRGLGGPEAFADLESLAGVLTAAVGSSRAACDLGWYPPSQQVGLTGTVVSPTLYVAIAISGASQHMAGCGGSKNIVAINKDPDAPIFSFSRFGIVDDYKKVLPALEAAFADALD
ncbi:MAG: electron transfer flavoprotein subunit alpha/FixB family protein [Chloroflexi bacterium]|nr:electron transfer flavoprotein subunit alpha/FixB family protein [Chloroflexota bacterium]MYF23243.1 electron transfer flavoprotein subunit alpha/FixB family protein [Chloroflexota bacterium]